METKKEKRILAFERPDLIKEWDSKKNIDICSPDEVTVYSTKKVWWKCKECGHEWQTSVKHRYQGHGCPACANKARALSNSKKHALSEQYNLEVCNPKLSKEWDTENNKSLKPTMVSPFSSKKVWWKCSACGNKWQAVISSRNNGTGCPYCSGRRPIIGKSDLPTTNPDLMKEWDMNRNAFIDPYSLMAQSHKNVWWKCSVCGFEWQAKISDRKRGNGCPACSKAKRTSAPEQTIFFYVKEAFPDAVNSWRAKWLLRSEIDIYIPSLSLGIEYDGERWHRDTAKDVEKDRLAFEHGIQIIRFREEGCPAIDDGSIVINLEPKDPESSYLSKAIRMLFQIIQDKYHLDMEYPLIDIPADSIKIYSSYEGNKKEKSLAYISPEIASTWNYEKNEGLKPENIANQSNKKVWWKCPECGYEWQATVNNRIKRGCPACADKVVWPGHNDICTVMPEMAKDWNYERNGNLRPEMFTVGSEKSVWWKCPLCGYEWKGIIYGRKRSYDTKQKAVSCPACEGKDIWKGHNDLMSLNPLLANEWCYEKNGDLKPDEVTLGTTKAVWWRCTKCHHEWKTSVYNRAKLHSGCPKCARKNISEKNGKKVECVETGKIYSSCNEAGKAVNRSGSAIKCCIDGKTSTCAGLHWRLVD